MKAKFAYGYLRSARPRLCLMLAVLAGTLAAGQRARAQVTETITGSVRKNQDLRYGGVGMDVTLANGSGLNTVGQNYRNDLSLRFEPRWEVGRRFFSQSPVWSKLNLSGRFTLTRALSGTDAASFGPNVNGQPITPCSDVTPSANGGVINPDQVQRCNPASNDRRIGYSDVWISASLPRYAKIPKLGLELSSSVRVILPTSLESRYDSLRMGMTAASSLGRGFFSDRVRISYGLGLTKNLHAYTTPGLSPSGSSAAEQGGNPYSGPTGTSISNLYNDPSRVGGDNFNTSWSVLNSLSAMYKINDKWSIDALYWFVDGFTYGHPCVSTVAGQVVDTCSTGDAVAAGSGADLTRVGHRKSQIFWSSVNYSFNKWLGFSLAWINWAPRLKPDSSYRQGFISTDYNAFTTVMFGATISVDELAARWTSAPARTETSAAAFTPKTQGTK